jgi:hypothetical protein
MDIVLEDYLNSICCEEILPLNRIEFTTGNAPTIEGLEAILGFSLINGQKVGDVITFDNTGYHIPDNAFENNANLISFDVASGVTAGQSSFHSCHLLVSGFDNLVDAGTTCFFDCTSLTSEFNNLISAGDYCFTECISLQNGFGKLETFGFACFNGCILLNSNFDSLVSIGDNSLGGCVSLTTLNFGNVVNFGNTTGDDAIFIAITGKTITVSAKSIHQTSNGGNLEGDLAYLADNNTVTFNWV